MILQYLLVVVVVELCWYNRENVNIVKTISKIRFFITCLDVVLLLKELHMVKPSLNSDKSCKNSIIIKIRPDLLPVLR